MADNTISNSLPPSQQQKVTVGGGAGGGAAGMHHHHHHHHHHHNHHKSVDMGGTGKMGGSKHHSNVIHRTTSESLRLGGGGGGGATGNGSSMNSVGGGGGGGGMVTGGGTNANSIGSNENSVSSSSIPASSSSVNSISRKSASSTASGQGAGGGGGGPPSGAGKTSSFTITSVIVVPGKHSTDNGDDSADDLDESHTDDNSRITDFENETPSFSEDTFSKEDVFFGTNAIGSVPVIPTSSQYGLAIVAPTDRAHGGEALADAMHVSVTDGGINIMGHGKGEMGDGKELHHRNERFKVVKIESTEPFKRGRWVCMDYLDHTLNSKESSNAPGTGGGAVMGGEGNDGANNNATVTQDSGVGLNENASYAPSDGTLPGGTSGEVPNADGYLPSAAASSASPAVVCGSVATASSTTSSNVNSVVLGLLNNESPGQSLNLPLVGTTGAGTGGTASVPQMAPPQAAQQSQQQQQTSHVQSATSGQGGPSGGGGGVGGGAGIPHSLPQSQLQSALAGQHQQQQQQTQPTAAYSQPQGQSQYYPHTMTNLAELNQGPVSNAAAHQHQHGATLPSNMQMHPQQQPSSNAAVSSSTILPPLVAPIPTSQEMNIIINNPTIQSSFPSPHQQFKPQPQQQGTASLPSQTNSPGVVPTSLLEGNNPALAGTVPSETVATLGGTGTILSPSAGTGTAPAGAPSHDTAGSVSIATTDPLISSSPSATSSPVASSSSQIIPQPSSSSAAAAASPAAAVASSGTGAPSPAVAVPGADPAGSVSSSVPSSATTNAGTSAGGGTTNTNNVNGAAATNGTNGAPGATAGSPSSSSGSIATAAIGDQLSEAKLLSAVSGVTAGTGAGDGEDADKAGAEDGESAGLQSQQQPLQPPALQQQQQQPPQHQQTLANALRPMPDAGLANASFQNASLDRSIASPPGGSLQRPVRLLQPRPQQPQFVPHLPPSGHDSADKLSKAYSLPPSMSAAAKESLRKELAQNLAEHQGLQQQQQQFVAGAGAFNVVISSSANGTTGGPGPGTLSAAARPANFQSSNVYTDIALGRSIQNLMKPTPTLPTVVSSRPAGASLNRSIGALGPCRELPELSQEPSGYCRAATSLLGNFTGSNSVSACTATYPHRCVQDLIKEELGGFSLPGRAASMGPASNRLSKAGSMINMSYDSDLFGAGSQSHPASGRSSPAFMPGTTPVGSPPRLLNPFGPSFGGGGSGRVSRAPSPSLLHAAGGASGGEHSSASGTSAVAIDNKIEQAMDLVKSHLMFAVREEVEVLKERISELMDRINQLEYENNILKANASQETLAQLTTGGSSVAAAAAVAAVAAAAAVQQQQQQVTTAAAAAAAATATAGTTKVPPSSANPANGSVS